MDPDCRGCMTTDVYEKAIGLTMDFPFRGVR